MSFALMLMGAGGLRGVAVTLTTDQSPDSIYVLAGNPADPVAVVVTVNAAVTILAGSPAGAALRTGAGWASGSTIRIVNNGNIVGAGGPGGVGGNGGNPPTAGGNGGNAGDAMDLQWPVSIDNTNGNIFGGGGGGGRGNTGGASGAAGVGSTGSGSTAQPGGAGSSAGAGAGGNAANRVGGGIEPGFAQGGNGGSGGGWGVAGVAGVSGNPSNTAFAPGGGAGAGGFAVRRNGNAVTWLGGNNSTQVQGSDA